MTFFFLFRNFHRKDKISLKGRRIRKNYRGEWYRRLQIIVKKVELDNQKLGIGYCIES